MDFYPRYDWDGDESSFNNHILVLPSVSYANIGQLAIDCVLNTLLSDAKEHEDNSIQLAGYLSTSSVPPMAGSCAFTYPSNKATAPSLTVNLELYQIKSKKQLILQQRTPILSGKSLQFATDLMLWAKKCGIAGVYVVAGANNMLRSDAIQSSEGVFTTIGNTEMQIDKTLLHNHSFLERFSSKHTIPEDNSSLKSKIQSKWKDVKGTGVAPFVAYVAEQMEMPFAALIMVCAEGDNIREAAVMASYVWSFLKLSVESASKNDDTAHISGLSIRLPPSWSQMFGSEPNSTLY
uniref:Proteasome assembly chaperone 2 n=1 Tax=Albugo laibachii Nc14 TaxID=890382 RepID=F0W7A3_9STRA|nr:proteasome assembly chaperone putative [Albugo laibachii Nc14]|eukprot:CCA17002.1 proteasome assembly chaperone putative [Albugo laibachii Nc14]